MNAEKSLLPEVKQASAAPPPRAQAGASRKTFVIVGLLLLVAGGALAWFIHQGITSRVSAEAALVKETKASAAIVVSVTHPRTGAGVQELILQGNAQPQMDASIYARTSGYLKKWYADIGAHVKAGQLLAEIEAPDLDDQLEQAKADLETAKSNLKLAETQATRWQGLLQTNAVSQDEADQKNAAFAADRAIVNSGTANVKHLEDLKSFERVTAPFDGVITARRVDVGALINTGSGSAAGPELFHIVSADRLRVFINVPEEYQRLAENGAKETLTLTEYPGRFFTGTIARNSGAIDPSSRTLQVEVDVENPNGEILPGAYVLVHFKLPDRGNAMTVPVNTVLFRSEGLRVAVVRDGKAELVPVQVGRDFGDSLEIVSGITPKETLIVNPPDSLVSGASVQISDSAGR